MLHIDPKADEEEVSEDEIRMMVDLGEERGTIEANEKELIDNIFEFNNTTAEDVMVHRTDMVMIWADDPADEILRTIRRFRDVTLSGVRGGCRRYYRSAQYPGLSA